MINIKRINTWPCKQAACFKPALYEFTNVYETMPKGSVIEHKQVQVIGHSCEHHVEEVNQLLKGIYHKGEEDDSS
jgi:hypothetical protein